MIGCHSYEAVRASGKPESWRRLFAECPACLRPMIKGEVHGRGEVITIWLCPPCLVASGRAAWHELQRP